MSKNFELLQRVGSEEELFQPTFQSVSTVSAKEDPNLELDQEARDKILRNASLPDVLQTASELPSNALGARSEFRSVPNRESVATNVQHAPAANEFRNSRNPSNLIGEPAKRTPSRLGHSRRRSHPLPEAFSPTERPGVSSVVASRESISKVPTETFRTYFPKSVSPFAWIEGIRTAANRWARGPQAPNNHYGIDVDALAREEEIKLVQRIFPGTDEDSPRIALFAALDGEVGCASICARAAETLAARAEGPVCAVDANFQSPSLHKYFGVENERGLVEATLESGPIQNFAQQIPVPDLWLMPSGKAAAELRFPEIADGLRVRMAELRSTFRYVVIHSGPLRLETSAMLLSRWTDGVVLVLEANSTRRDTARRTTENLVAAGVSVLGIVLNNRTFPIPEAIYRRI
jgi:Mrp family chromosome partitioning ATPase